MTNLSKKIVSQMHIVFFYNSISFEKYFPTKCEKFKLLCIPKTSRVFFGNWSDCVLDPLSFKLEPAGSHNSKGLSIFHQWLTWKTSCGARQDLVGFLVHPSLLYNLFCFSFIVHNYSPLYHNKTWPSCVGKYSYIWIKVFWAFVAVMQKKVVFAGKMSSLSVCK